MYTQQIQGTNTEYLGFAERWTAGRDSCSATVSSCGVTGILLKRHFKIVVLLLGKPIRLHYVDKADEETCRDGSHLHFLYKQASSTPCLNQTIICKKKAAFPTGKLTKTTDQSLAQPVTFKRTEGEPLSWVLLEDQLTVVFALSGLYKTLNIRWSHFDN